MITCIFEDNVQARGGLRHVTLNVLVIDNNRILLGKRGSANGKPMLEAGKWGLLGGFLDRDETLIEGAKREVREESGCEIKNVILFRINDNPNRPMEDRQNVDIVFIAELDSQTPHINEEVTHLEWFPLEQLPPSAQLAFDHGEEIELYKQHLKSKKQLPLLG